MSAGVGRCIHCWDRIPCGCHKSREDHPEWYIDPLWRLDFSNLEPHMALPARNCLLAVADELLVDAGAMLKLLDREGRHEAVTEFLTKRDRWLQLRRCLTHGGASTEAMSPDKKDVP